MSEIRSEDDIDTLVVIFPIRQIMSEVTFLFFFLHNVITQRVNWLHNVAKQDV